MICCILFPTMGERERVGVFSVSFLASRLQSPHMGKKDVHCLLTDIFATGCYIFMLFFSFHSFNKGVCVTLTLALPFTFKKYLNAKEEDFCMVKLKYFTMQKYDLLKNPLKETQILNSIITNLKF